jgi:hypothetical protein
MIPSALCKVAADSIELEVLSQEKERHKRRLEKRQLWKNLFGEPSEESFLQYRKILLEQQQNCCQDKGKQAKIGKLLQMDMAELKRDKIERVCQKYSGKIADYEKKISESEIAYQKSWFGTLHKVTAYKEKSANLLFVKNILEESKGGEVLYANGKPVLEQIFSYRMKQEEVEKKNQNYREIKAGISLGVNAAIALVALVGLIAISLSSFVVALPPLLFGAITCTLGVLAVIPVFVDNVVLTKKKPGTFEKFLVSG